MKNIASMTAAIALGVTVAAPALAQDPVLLACAPASEVLKTDATAAHQVVGAPAQVTATLEAFAGGTVSEIFAQVDDGSEPVPIPAPGEGTIAGAVVYLPGYVGRATVTVSWRQSAVDGVSAECRGASVFTFEVGPSGSELRGYIARVAGAQVQWLTRLKRLAVIEQQFADAVPDGRADADAFRLFRAAAQAAGRRVEGLRPFSRRYRALVLASAPPDGLGDENRDLARTSALFDTQVTVYYADLSRARTLADITIARRASQARYQYRRQLRATWRKAVMRANVEAGVKTPRWLTRVGA